MIILYNLNNHSSNDSNTNINANNSNNNSNHNKEEVLVAQQHAAVAGVEALM